MHNKTGNTKGVVQTKNGKNGYQPFNLKVYPLEKEDRETREFTHPLEIFNKYMHERASVGEKLAGLQYYNYSCQICGKMIHPDSINGNGNGNGISINGSNGNGKSGNGNGKNSPSLRNPRKLSKEEGESYVQFLRLHHVVPRSFGGGNAPSNLMPLCNEEHVMVHQVISHMWDYLEKNISQFIPRLIVAVDAEEREAIKDLDKARLARLLIIKFAGEDYFFGVVDKIRQIKSQHASAVEYAIEHPDASVVELFSQREDLLGFVQATNGLYLPSFVSEGEIAE